MTPDPVQNETRRRHSWARTSTIGAAAAGLPVFIFGFVWSLTAEPVEPPWAPWALGGLLVVALGVLAWGYIWHLRHPLFHYETDRGATWGFRSEEVYSAPERMQRLEDVLYQALLRSDLDLTHAQILAAIDDVAVTVIAGELPMIGPIDPAGMTSRETRTSMVEWDVSRSLGTIGWECYLQLADHVAPAEIVRGSEPDKAEWGREVGILPLEEARETTDIAPLDASLEAHS